MKVGGIKLSDVGFNVAAAQRYREEQGTKQNGSGPDGSITESPNTDPVPIPARRQALKSPRFPFRYPVTSPVLSVLAAPLLFGKARKR